MAYNCDISIKTGEDEKDTYDIRAGEYGRCEYRQSVVLQKNIVQPACRIVLYFLVSNL